MWRNPNPRHSRSLGWRTGRVSLCFVEQGVPIRIEIGPKDVANKQAVLVRRDTGEKYTVPIADIAVAVPNLLDTIQRDMLTKARRQRDERVSVITEYVTGTCRSRLMPLKKSPRH